MGTAAQFQWNSPAIGLFFKEHGNLVKTALEILVFWDGSTFLERLHWVLLKAFFHWVTSLNHFGSGCAMSTGYEEGPENTKICLLSGASPWNQMNPLCPALAKLVNCWEELNPWQFSALCLSFSGFQCLDASARLLYWHLSWCVSNKW